MNNTTGMGLGFRMVLRSFKANLRGCYASLKMGFAGVCGLLCFWFIKCSQFKVSRGKALNFKWVNGAMATYAYGELARVKYLGQS